MRVVNLTSMTATSQVFHDSGEVGFVYHETEILTKLPGGRIRLNSGGFETPTTKKRINSFLPLGWQVIQRNFKWYVRTPAGEDIPFVDGLVLNT